MYLPIKGLYKKVKRERSVEERRSMATHKEVNHNISLNYKKRIEHHPLKKTHHPIENHGHIKRKCWVSEIHDNRNVGRISH